MRYLAGLILLALAVLSSVLPAAVAAEAGRVYLQLSPNGTNLLGLVVALSSISVLVGIEVVIARRLYRPCPSCQSYIRQNALRCPYCRSTVTQNPN